MTLPGPHAALPTDAKLKAWHPKPCMTDRVRADLHARVERMGGNTILGPQDFDHWLNEGFTHAGHAEANATMSEPFGVLNMQALWEYYYIEHEHCDPGSQRQRMLQPLLQSVARVMETTYGILPKKPDLRRDKDVIAEPPLAEAESTRPLAMGRRNHNDAVLPEHVVPRTVVNLKRYRSLYEHANNIPPMLMRATREEIESKLADTARAGVAPDEDGGRTITLDDRPLRVVMTPHGSSYSMLVHTEDGQTLKEIMRERRLLYQQTAQSHTENLAARDHGQTVRGI